MRSRRWVRVAIPVALLAVLWTLTLVFHSLDEPDLRDPGTLAPTGTGPHGSSQLAAQLAQAGVTVTTVTSTLDAVQALTIEPATIFVPEPDFVFAGGLTYLGIPRLGQRLVIVRPGRDTILTEGLPLDEVGERWATKAVAPDCGLPVAASAGVASVRRAVYVGAGATCYGGSLLQATEDDGDIVTVVGATDPFRNDRIGEHGNAALALGLLSTTRQVIWLDLHSPEPAPAQLVVVPPVNHGGGSGSGTGSGSGSGGGTGSGGGSGSGGGGSSGGGSSGDNQADGDQSVFTAFPPLLWLSLLLVVLAAVLLALARGRRLGAPVPEPLPVLVPAAETVRGRGRLYQRIGAHAATMAVLRQAAIDRLTVALRPPHPDALVGLVAARIGATDDQVRSVLHGPPPTDPDQLAMMVARLDDLEQIALRSPQIPAGGSTP